MKSILFIPNGHGEDIVAAKIIEHLDTKRFKVDVMPVIGKGEAFKRSRNVSIVGPRKELPSGGFGLRNYSFLLKDILSGYFLKVASQIKTLRKFKRRYHLVVAIGDIVPILYGMFTESDMIFVGINKSEYYKLLAFNYTRFEKFLLKKFAKLTIARDQLTAGKLSEQKINAVYVGNPMMDMGQNSRISGDQKIRKTNTIGFLPGTREDAYKNIEDFYKVAWHINQINKKIKFILSVPASLDKSRINKIKSPIKLEMTSDFSRILKKSNIIVGLSGTGNEQAAGLGIPVVTFPGRGAQFNSRFARGQKQLLGDSILLCPRNSKLIAQKVLEVIKNKKLMSKMSAEGKKRMGKPGASKAIAKIITKHLKLWKRQQSP